MANTEIGASKCEIEDCRCEIISICLPVFIFSALADSQIMKSYHPNPRGCWQLNVIYYRKCKTLELCAMNNSNTLLLIGPLESLRF